MRQAAKSLLETLGENDFVNVATVGYMYLSILHSVYDDLLIPTGLTHKAILLILSATVAVLYERLF